MMKENQRWGRGYERWGRGYERRGSSSDERLNWIEACCLHMCTLYIKNHPMITKEIKVKLASGCKQRRTQHEKQTASKATNGRFD